LTTASLSLSHTHTLPSVSHFAATTCAAPQALPDVETMTVNSAQEEQQCFRIVIKAVEFCLERARKINQFF